MRTHTRMLLGTLAAALVLASALNTASARNLSVSQQPFRFTWRSLTTASGSGGSGITLSCRITLEGSFHYTTMIKQPRALIGWVTKADVERPCAGAGNYYLDNGVENAGLAEGARPNTLPWVVSYEAFLGRLPEISGLRILLRPVLLISVGLLCRYSGNAQGVVNVNASGEPLTITPDGTVGITKISGGILCPGNSFFSASSADSNVTVLGNTTRITIRLI